MFLFSVTETSILRQVSYTTTTTTTHTVTATQTVHESGAETSDTSSVPRSHFTSQTAAARRRPLSYTDLKRRPAALQVNGTLPLGRLIDRCFLGSEVLKRLLTKTESISKCLHCSSPLSEHKRFPNKVNNQINDG